MPKKTQYTAYIDGVSINFSRHPSGTTFVYVGNGKEKEAISVSLWSNSDAIEISKYKDGEWKKISE